MYMNFASFATDAIDQCSKLLDYKVSKLMGCSTSSKINFVGKNKLK